LICKKEKDVGGGSGQGCGPGKVEGYFLFLERPLSSCSMQRRVKGSWISSAG
jgi:hypothetical protein